MVNRRDFVKALGAGAAVWAAAPSAGAAHEPIKVGVITNAEGAHLDLYFSALAEAQEVASVILADPSGKAVAGARKCLGEKLAATYDSCQAMLDRETPVMALVSLEARLASPAIEAGPECRLPRAGGKAGVRPDRRFCPPHGAGGEQAAPLDAGLGEPLEPRSPGSAAADPGRKDRQDLRPRNAHGRRSSGYYLDQGYHSHLEIWGSRGWLQLEKHGGTPLTWYSQDEPKAEVHRVETIDGPSGYSPFVRAWPVVDAVRKMADDPRDENLWHVTGSCRS
jgi:hypothetical protein